MDVHRIATITVGVVAAVSGLVVQAYGHGAPADLSVWGGFNPQVTRCQRSIARAATLCASRALLARSSCSAAQLRGEACDQTALDAAVQSARQRARDAVTRDCAQEQLLTLRYVDLADAQSDVINVCRQLDTAAVSAAFAPASFGGTIAAMEGDEQACVAATARATSALLRYAMRARQRALDQIAATVMEPAAKTALVARSALSIGRARALLQRRVDAACPTPTFADLYGQNSEMLLGRIAGRADCLAESVYVQNAVVCPPAECGDGMHIVPDEECDDGNDYDGDGCRVDCVKTECDVFPTTYDLIQTAIFDNQGCSVDACHGAIKSGGLDLRAGASYDSLNDVAATTVLGKKRVEPGSKDDSLLWINLAARTLPDDYTAPLRGMPIGGNAISEEALEALGLWIETGGAAREANLPAAASLLAACVPEPEPVKIDPLEPPAPGTGVQMHMPAYILPGKSETEVCFTSYYDFTDQIPAELLSPDGKTFRYKTVEVRQDPLSHHLIVDVFRGDVPPDDPIWGVYHCTPEGAHAGEVCDPLDLDFCGAGQCATAPDPLTIACIGFGPTEGLGGLGSGGFAFAQETTAHFRYPEAVYDELPVKGNILWNSHAFNLTRKAGSLEAWINIYFPKPDEQDYPQQQIFDASEIFWNENFPPFPQVELPPYHAKEFCNLHEFKPVREGFAGGSLLAVDETAHLFEISGHMHRHGKRFQIYRGAFTCAGGTNAGDACNPAAPEMCPASACVDAGGRDPQQALLYTNFVYNDPVVLRFDPPILFSGSAAVADRTFTYCGYYDNGLNNPAAVKRRSTSPPGGVLFDIFTVGGPCAQNKTQCMNEGKRDVLCNGNDALCDSSPGAGDGDCDACPLTGGFRTEDEMFIMFGNYWATKN
jgi:cysteine-rich repeat protein